MDNIEYTGHNTETKKIKIKHRKKNQQQTRMNNIEYTSLRVVSCVLNVVHSWLPIETNKIKTIRRKQNKNNTEKTKSAIMNGQHWVNTTQHGDKQNKNKTKKAKSATLMNGQHWVHRTQHRDKENKNKTVFCVLFLFCLSPCGVLCTQCCPFMIAVFVFCALFLFCLSSCCVLYA
jgi:ERCC4-related helicase